MPSAHASGINNDHALNPMNELFGCKAALGSEAQTNNSKYVTTHIKTMQLLVEDVSLFLHSQGQLSKNQNRWWSVGIQ